MLCDLNALTKSDKVTCHVYALECQRSAGTVVLRDSKSIMDPKLLLFRCLHTSTML